LVKKGDAAYNENVIGQMDY